MCRRFPPSTGWNQKAGTARIRWSDSRVFKRGRRSIAFPLGFVHEEEFEIIALCAGSTYRLELMTAYVLAVIAGTVALTMALIAGYQHYGQRVERYAPYLPVVSAVVLVTMDIGFITELLRVGRLWGALGSR